MIRDNLEPEPPYTVRMIDHEGKKVLAIEVTAASQTCAYRKDSRALRPGTLSHRPTPRGAG